jgi:hypothetical protein
MIGAGCRLLIVACATLSLTAACSHPTVSATATASVTATTGQDMGAAPQSSQLPRPSGQPVVLLTHCGIQALTVGGVLWIADPALGSDNPPPGWDQNGEQGFFAETTPGHGQFDDGRGHRAAFRLAIAGEPDPLQGCA